MDLRQYFKKIKDTEASIEDEYPLIVSLETTDGGKPGALSKCRDKKLPKRLWRIAQCWRRRSKDGSYMREAARGKAG